MPGRELKDNLTGNNSYPQDVTSERAILALCLKNKEIVDNIIKDKLLREDFYDERNGLIFSAMMELYTENMPIDPYTVCSVLEKKVEPRQKLNNLERAGGNEYVLGIIDTYAVKASVVEYVNIVREKSKRRTYVKTLENMLKKAMDSGTDSTNDLVDATIGTLSSMREETVGVGFESLGSILKRNIQEIYEVSLNGKKNSAIRTGFRGLDFKLGGLRPGTLNILAARPGMGKTAFAINIATNVATFYHVPVNIFSLEMSKGEIANRILASKTSFSTKELQKAKLSPEKLHDVALAGDEMTGLPIYIDDNSGVNPVSMISSCKELQSQGHLGLVIVDYLQLMTLPGKGANYSRQQEISDISRSLKLLAKEMNVPVIALSQLSRGAEKRDDHTPMLSDLRDSGAIEQDADSVWFIDRNDYYKTEGDEKVSDNEVLDARVIIAKNRHGERGDVKLKWIGSRTLFFDPPKDSDPQESNYQGRQSSYTATVPESKSAANYQYEDNPPPPPPAPEDVPPPPPEDAYGGYSGEPVPESYPVSEDDVPQEASSDNEEFFADGETYTELPGDLFGEDV